MIAAIVHELGHIIVGVISGFKFYLFSVGPFGFKSMKKGKITFYIQKNITLWGGMSATLPQNNDSMNFKKFKRVMIGGPIVSVLFGLIWTSVGVTNNIVFVLLMGAISLGMGIVCLLPVRNGAFYTDGGSWLRMHKQGREKEVEMAVWNITQSSIINENYANSDLDDIEILKRDDDTRTKYMGYYFAYCFYKDNGNFLKADNEKKVLADMKLIVPRQMAMLYHI